MYSGTTLIWLLSRNRTFKFWRSVREDGISRNWLCDKFSLIKLHHDQPCCTQIYRTWYREEYVLVQFSKHGMKISEYKCSLPGTASWINAITMIHWQIIRWWNLSFWVHDNILNIPFSSHCFVQLWHLTWFEVHQECLLSSFFLQIAQARWSISSFSV